MSAPLSNNRPDDAAGAAVQPSGPLLVRKIGAVTLGVAASAALGYAATLLRPSDGALAVVAIFMALTAPALIGIAWILLVPVEPEYRHGEDTVERAWYRQAVYGAFHDLLITLGLTLAALSVGRVEVAGTTMLIVILVALAADVAVRYQRAKRAGRG